MQAAYLGGADTIELCGQMELDGLTPLAKNIAIAREAFADRPGLMVMIRPRGGDFCYSRAEIEAMLLGVETAVSHGADGVVFGVIKDNKLDTKTMRRLVSAAHQHNLKTTCHRAFDATSNPTETMEALIDLGVSRALTSGTPWGSGQSALSGISLLNDLIDQANKRIEIVLGGGIQISNVGQLLNQLPFKTSSLAVHTYSGVLRHGITNQEAVRQLVEAMGAY